MSMIRHCSKAFALALLAVFASTAGTAEPVAQPMTFDIAPKPLNLALTEFAQQAGLQVVFVAEIGRDLSTPGLSGSYTPQAALNQLLAGTPFGYDFLNPRTVTIRAKGEGKVGLAVSFGEDGMRVAQADSFFAGAGSADAGKDPQGNQNGAGSPGNVESLQLEEVVVTAQKRRERLQDVPMSLSVLTATSIERRSFLEANDFLKSVPGVEYQEVAAGQSGIRIRGIDGGVGVYLNDMPIEGGVDLKLIDMERVEILRGPQGTLYGAGSMGGTLRYIPKAPDATRFTGDFTAGFRDTDHSGNYGKNFTAAVNIPLVQDKLAVRVVGYFYETPGYIRLVGGTIPALADFAAAVGTRYISADDAGKSEYVGGRLALLWSPLENLNATLTYIHQEIEQLGAPENNITLPPYSDYPLDTGGFTSDGRERRRNRSPLANLSLNLELEKVSLTSSTSYMDYSVGEVRDIARDLGPGSLGVAMVAIQRNTVRSLTQELRARSKFAIPLNFMMGLYHDDKKARDRGDYPWSGDPALCCTAYPDVFDFGSDPNNLYFDGRNESLKQKALFGEAYYDLSKTLRLTVGGRYYDYDRTKTQFANGVLNGGETITSGSTSEQGTTFKASVTYSPTSDSMFYAQWAQGFRPGSSSAPAPRDACDQNNDGILDGTSAPIDTDHVDADTVDSWEIGGKSTLWNGRVSVNAAAYRLYWDGIPSAVLSPTCGIAVSVNAGKARVDGLELESILALSSQTYLNLGVSILDGKLTEDATSLNAVTGDKLLAPPYQVNVGLEQRLNVHGHEAYIRTDYSYIDDYRWGFGTVDGVPFEKISGYGQLDFRAGLKIRNISAAIYGMNLTNEDAIVQGGAPFVRAVRLRPRTLGVEFGYRF